MSELFDPQRRFGGLQRLYGNTGAMRIAQAHVAVVGIGGVGSWAAEALARSGVGKLTLIDLDNVAESNINRQIHALTDTIGQPKVEAMKARIAQINPSCTVHVVEDFVDENNVQALLATNAIDATIDACDQVRAKAAIAQAMLQSKRIFISVGAAGGKTQAQQVEVQDLGLLTHDPLLAQLRYRLRRHYHFPSNGKKMQVPCVFSRESVKQANSSCATQEDNTLNCAGYGSTVTVTATFGMVAAGWVLNNLGNF
ncbi:tRNA threonylcarbamoyladenosine dehydratase [Lampropedia puyangensis]|uniref:tRNA threonylcarbamoyladenosine dehydratase n=1 Tax=Lampropedia puyangensis TaxID=1330072 RepID=A0A4V4GS26_9BURK|nr:tRNA threonylcarbamoyladenosine dehydratase [Lampropedia puyangensis]THU04506.1 tRNA threonylcarbamoyladenosine dehydratase [Lampropedia puyangensis]